MAQNASMYWQMAQLRWMLMNNTQTQPFRHELKYLISQGEKAVLLRRLQYICQPDEHAKDGRYMIRSLYFDDIWETAYEEKMSGTYERCKYRIRNYDCSDQIIRLERKRKEGQYIQKMSAPLTREETEQILEGRYAFLLQRQEGICQDFYIECMAKRMRPKVIVDYDREPYVYEPGEVRITFDSHVRAGVLQDNLFDARLPVREVLEPGTLIMEVKFTEFLPQIIRDMLHTTRGLQMAASKYVMCLEKRKELV